MLVFGAPPISGLGTSAGFKLMVEATGEVDFNALQTRADELAAKGNEQPNLVGLFNGFRARTPQLYVDIDREKVKSMGVALSDVFDTLAGVRRQLPTSTISTASAGPGRSMSRPTPPSAWTRKRSNSSRSATATATWCRWGRWPRCATAPGRCRSPATTCSRWPRSTACRGPGPAQATPWRRMEKLKAEKSAAQHGVPSGPR